ncbi:ribosome silencing factor [Bartonella sp. F02]|uniref:ribosome silencing factor n=1 Tax=Bartonella sp. F02 TaxID=2967262 RepID=UPI0022A912CD|nr:ribosome silencing factor [Bartonella sp. F02]MCZ2328396.1 ribosome silencing factor [Bartonella sp. F02]
MIRKGITLESVSQKHSRNIALVEDEFFSSADSLKIILSSLEDTKAEDIVSIDIKGKSFLADYMVIASGRSQRHVTAVADHLLCTWKDNKYGTARVEGLTNGDWVLIDTGDIIVHLFHPETRAFYNLEKMWQTSDWDNIKSVFIGEN